MKADGTEGAIDLGGENYWRWLDDGNAIWADPNCRSWNFVDCTSGQFHHITEGAPGADVFTIRASLLCPQGCGAHGFVTNGRWEAA